MKGRATEQTSILRQTYEIAHRALAESHEIDAVLDWKLAAVVARTYLSALEAGEIAGEESAQVLAQRSLGQLLTILGPPRKA